MTTSCSRCNKNLGTWDAQYKVAGAVICQECYVRNSLAEKRKYAETETAREKERREAVLLTTEAVPPFQVIERIDVITAECVFGMNIVRDLFADVRNVFGGRSKAMQKVFRDARKAALTELREEALEIGANAVVGVAIHYHQMGAGGGSFQMLMVAASGTAVVFAEPVE